MVWSRFPFPRGLSMLSTTFQRPSTVLALMGWTELVSVEHTKRPLSFALTVPFLGRPLDEAPLCWEEDFGWKRQTPTLPEGTFPGLGQRNGKETPGGILRRSDGHRLWASSQVSPFMLRADGAVCPARNVPSERKSPQCTSPSDKAHVEQSMGSSRGVASPLLSSSYSGTCEKGHAIVSYERSASSSSSQQVWNDSNDVALEKCELYDEQPPAYSELTMRGKRPGSVDTFGPRAGATYTYLDSTAPFPRQMSDLGPGHSLEPDSANEGLRKWRGSVLAEDDGHGDCSGGHRPSVKLSKQGECFEVVLHRGWHTKLGFSLGDCGPAATNDVPMAPFVKAVYPGSVAAMDGRIRVGDSLVQVNEKGLVGVPSKEAIDFVKRCTGHIRMLFVRTHEPNNSA